MLSRRNFLNTVGVAGSTALSWTRGSYQTSTDEVIWPSSQANMVNTGLSDQSVLNTYPEIDSSTTFDAGVSVAPVGSEQYSYIYTLRNLWAFDDEGEAWRFTPGGDWVGHSSPVIDDENIYFGAGSDTDSAEDGNAAFVYALDRTTGDVQWRHKIADKDWMDVGVVLDDDKVITGTASTPPEDASDGVGQALALSKSNGDLEWATNITPESVPAVYNGEVYMAGSSGRVYALDGSSGEIQWEFNTGGSMYSPTVTDDAVYASNHDGFLYAIDRNTGEQLWNFDAPGGLSVSPAVWESYIIAGTWHGRIEGGSDAVVFALNPDGSTAWTVDINANVTSDPVVVDNVLYISTLDGVLHALDPEDGTELWNFGLGGEFWVSPTIDSDGMIMTANDGTVSYLVDQSADQSTETTPPPSGNDTQEGNTSASDNPIRGSGPLILGGASGTLALILGYLGWRRRTESGVSESDSDDSVTDSAAKVSTDNLTKSNGTAKSEDDAAQADDKNVGKMRDGVRGPPPTIPTSKGHSLEFESFEKEEYIGGGANADVYRAIVTKSTTSEVYAIKEPRFSGSIDQGTIDRFLSEAEIWSKVDDHEFIVSVYDYDDEPAPWIRLEYMDGGSLRKRIGATTIPEAAWYTQCIADGVAHAHSHGVAHLDLKPENILFRTTEPEYWDVPKVSDWGLAKMLLEHSKSVQGLSPEYAAPEQFDQDVHGPPDQRTDIYQLGTIFYELFTGQPPFVGDMTSIMHSTLHEEIEPPTAVNPQLPERLDEILLTALQRQKADRYESVLYLRDEMRNFYSDL